MFIARLMGSAGKCRSCYLEQLSREISEYLGPALGEVNIVFDADSSPARTVNSRLYRHHRARSQRRFHALGQSRRFVNLESQPVTEAVPKRVAVATLLNVATS